MKVILLENVKRIGSIGEVIEVKRGFARNFLIANKKALYASKENIKEVEKIKSDLSKKDNDKKSVVLIEYPRKGVWAVGFATKENTGEMAIKTKQKLINVFVPTTPNPTSGFLLMFPIDEVIYLNMTFEEASKFIVSAGTSSGKN